MKQILVLLLVRSLWILPYFRAPWLMVHKKLALSLTNGARKFFKLLNHKEYKYDLEFRPMML